MLNKVRNRLAQEEGFTLIELLVVILIIGILAAVAIPTFLSQKNKASDSNAQSNLKNAQVVVESYANGNNGNYPAGSNATLSSVLTNDSDTAALSSGSQQVAYTNPTAGSSDSYTLCAEGSNNSVPHFWFIVVTNGTAQYGEVNGTTSTQTCSGTTAPSGAALQASGFPAVQTT